MNALSLAHPKTLRRLLWLAAAACLLVFALLAGAALLLWNRAAGWVVQQDFSGAPLALESLVKSVAAELPQSTQSGAQLLNEASAVVTDAKALATAVTTASTEVAPALTAQLAGNLGTEFATLSREGGLAIAQANAAVDGLRQAAGSQPVETATAALAAAGLAAVGGASVDPAGLPGIEDLLRTAFKADAQPHLSYHAPVSPNAALSGLAVAAASGGFEVRVLPRDGSRTRLQLSQGVRHVEITIEPAGQGSTLRISES